MNKRYKYHLNFINFYIYLEVINQYFFKQNKIYKIFLINKTPSRQSLDFEQNESLHQQICIYFIQLIISNYYFKKTEDLYHKIIHSKQNKTECQIELQDQIKLFDYLGHGCFGVVLKGIKNNGEIVAVKLIKSENIENNKEFEIRKKFIDFEHIVKILEEPKEMDEFWILIMEYCQSDLKSEIKKKKENNEYFNENEICKIIFQIFDAILEIHSNQIIHADLKPDNILFMNEVIKITDFGISIKSDNLKFYGGTKLYYPPELIEFENKHLSKQQIQDKITFKIDIFSLGVTLLVLLGANILNGKSLGELIQEGKNLQIKELNIKDEYLSLFTFIKYEMLNANPNLRKSAIQLMKIFIDYFHTNNINLDSEIYRINKLIESIQEKYKYQNNQSEQNNNRQDNLRFLYCLLALLKQDPLENLKKSIINIQESKLNLSDQIFLKNQYVIALIEKTDYEEAEREIMITLQQIEQINDAQQKKILEFQSQEIQSDIYFRRDGKDDTKKALTLQELILKKKLQIYGLYHPEISLSYHAIAKTKNRIGKKNDALEYDKKNLDLLKCLYKGNHVFIAKTLNSLSYQYNELKQFQIAYDYGKESYKMIKKLKLENILKAHCMSNLAVCYTQKQDKKKAYKFRQQSLDLRRNLCGESHYQVAIAYTTFGSTCYHFKDFKQSLIYNWKGFQILFKNRKQHQTELKITFKRLCASAFRYIVRL